MSDPAQVESRPLFSEGRPRFKTLPGLPSRPVAALLSTVLPRCLHHGCWLFRWWWWWRSGHWSWLLHMSLTEWRGQNPQKHNTLMASKSEGLQPKRKGLQPKSDGPQPNTKRHGLQIRSYALRPKRNGLQPKRPRCSQLVKTEALARYFRRHCRRVSSKTRCKK